MTFKNMCEKLPTDFLGRICFVLQTDEEYKNVKSDSMIDKNFAPVYIDRNNFVAMYDYFKGMKISLTADEDKHLINIVQNISVPESFSGIYGKYTSRQAPLILFGIIKTRMFRDKSTTPKPIEEDFKTFEAVWKELIFRWFSKDDAIKNPFDYLTTEQLDLYKIFETDENHKIGYYAATLLPYKPEDFDRLVELHLIVADILKREYKLIPKTGDIIDLL